MSEKVETGGPAFPCDGVTPTNENGHFFGHAISSSGLTVRDYFAAKAMPACYAEYCAHANTQGYDEDWKMDVALDSYAMADAMLKAREVK